MFLDEDKEKSKEELLEELTYLRNQLEEFKQLNKRYFAEGSNYKKREEEFRALAENSPDIVARYDRNLRFLYVNPPIMALNGVPPEDYFGKTYRELEYPEYISKYCESKIKETFRTHKIQQDQFEVDGLAGHFIFDWILIPEYNGAGKVESVLTISRDITELKKTQKALSDSEKKLFFHIQQSPLAYIEWDATFKVLEWNPEAERIFGYSKEEVLNKNAYDLIVTKHVDVYTGNMSFFDGTGKTENQTKYGKRIYCEWYNTLIFDHAGQITGMVSLVDDITDIKETEEELFQSRQKFSVHIEKTPMSYVEVDKKLEVVNWNVSAEKTFGYPKDEAIGKDLLKLIVPPEMSEHMEEVFRSVLNQTGGYSSTCENVSKNGKKIVCEWHNTPLTDSKGTVKGASSIIHNITERIKSEEELKNAKRQAEGANYAKSEFLANMSHEIRTPLNGIIGMGELLSETFLNEEQKEYIDSINSSGKMLMTIIDDILDFSKIEARKLTLFSEPLYMKRLIQDIYNAIRVLAEQKDIELRLSIDDKIEKPVMGDTVRLRQVFMNLLGNAIKFTRKGYVELTVKSELLSNNTAVYFIEVKDTGIGIADEDKEKIFEKFTQSDNSSRRMFGGTGLGLAISTGLISMMGGTIKLDSKLGSGSTFYFDLKFTVSEENFDPDNEEPFLGDDLKFPEKVLIVEDNQVNQKLIMKMLTKLGCKVDLAENGIVALNKIMTNEYEIIFMDVHMPEMDGLDATEEIRAFEKKRNRYTPIIAMTALATKSDREKCLACGMDDYMPKPIRKKILVDILKKYRADKS